MRRRSDDEQCDSLFPLPCLHIHIQESNGQYHRTRFHDRTFVHGRRRSYVTFSHQPIEPDWEVTWPIISLIVKVGIIMKKL